MFGPMNPELAAVVKKHGIDSAALIGMSMGGGDPFAEKQSAKPDMNSIITKAMGATASIKDKRGFFIDTMPVFLKFLQSKEFTAIGTDGVSDERRFDY